MIKQSKNSLRKTASGPILLTVVLPWLLTRSGLAAEKFKVTLIGREETATLERQNEQFSAITSVDADEEGHIYVLDGREAVVKVFDAIKISLPGFLVDGDRVWLCSEDRMQLLSYSLKDGRRIDNLRLPEEYRPFRVIKSSEWHMIIVFQYGVPIVFDGSLHVLVFRYRYSGDSFRTLADGEAEATSIRLYRLRSNRLEKRADLGSHEGVVDLGFANDRRIVFLHNSPYPRVRILDLQ